MSDYPGFVVAIHYYTRHEAANVHSGLSSYTLAVARVHFKPSLFLNWLPYFKMLNEHCLHSVIFANLVIL